MATQPIPPKHTEASARAALLLFLISLGLHGGMRWLWGVSPLTNVDLRVWELASLALAIFFPLLVALGLLGLEARSALNLLPPNWRRTGVALVAGLALAFVFNMTWPHVVAPTPDYVERTQEFIQYEGTAELILVFLVVVLAAPLADELLFRGFLLRAWSVRYGAFVAVLLTALATALFHTWEPFKLGHAFVMGVIFATAVLWSRSVFTSILLHAALNASAFLPLAH